jgi:hypothetical protein
VESHRRWSVFYTTERREGVVSVREGGRSSWHRFRKRKKGWWCGHHDISSVLERGNGGKGIGGSAADVA